MSLRQKIQIAFLAGIVTHSISAPVALGVDKSVHCKCEKQEAELLAALQESERQYGANSARTATAMARLGRLRFFQHRTKEAKSLLHQSISIQRLSSKPDYHSLTEAATTLIELSEAFEPASAKTIAQEMMPVVQNCIKNSPGDLQLLDDGVRVAGVAGDKSAAIKLSERAISLARSQRLHPIMFAQRLVAHAELIGNGVASAKPYLREAISVRTKINRTDPQLIQDRRNLGKTKGGLSPAPLK